MEALRRLGHLAEGEAFVRFLRNVAEDSPLQPVYGIGGERNLQEEQLDHLAGFAGTKPVRIGNAASIQTQNDLMGEMVLCLETLLTDPRLVNDHSEASRRLLEGLVEQAIAPYVRRGGGNRDVPGDVTQLVISFHAALVRTAMERTI